MTINFSLPYRHRLKICVIFILVLFTVEKSWQVQAQVMPSNPATTNVDKLTDDQIKQLVQQGRSAGYTDDQIVQNAQSRGLSATEAQKLQQRIRLLNYRAKNNNKDDQGAYAQQPRTLNYQPDTLQKTRYNAPAKSAIFGADLFQNSNSMFEPNLKLATPVNYILGPEDELDINVYGKSVVNWKLNVSPDGNINMPSGGVIHVAGKTINDVTAIIKSRLIAKNYAIGNGTDVKVTLGNIRSIKVIMVGEVNKPGTYTLPSLATAFNALYAAGGPTDNGSLRQIEIIRNNRVIRHLDVYDFLVQGDQKDNISLQDQDIIRVPTYQTRVEMRGQIKIPAFFEVLKGETLQDILMFAGGFTSLAYRANITVSQISDQQRRITDVTETNYKNYIPLAGDIYTIQEILDRYENRVTINGAVFRPGVYELQKNMTLLQLITKASGLKEDAFTSAGTITRLNADNSTQLISFSLKEILNNTSSILLQREDVVNIQSVFDLHDKYTVSISGAVRNPGDFTYADSMKVENLILMAGGFSEGASSKRIEVARRVLTGDPTSQKTVTANVFKVDINPQLQSNDFKFTLKPFDMVLVYTVPGYEKQGLVRVEGEAVYPGTYTIEHKEEKISDIIKRAGGLTATADPLGSTLKRDYLALLGIDKNKTDTATFKREHLQRVDMLKQRFSDTSQTQEQVRNNFIGINLGDILKKPGSVTDLIVKDGDVIRIPQQQQIVQVNGEVHLPSGVVYENGKGFKQYIINAGGYSDKAQKRGAYVIYPNGTVKGTRKFLFFNSYPEIRPGSEIYVPQKTPGHGISIAEFVGLISAIGTTVLLGIVTLRH
jgi:protein involved in polysaccharide export with SLBB domain